MIRKTFQTGRTSLVTFGLWLLSAIAGLPETYLASQIVLGMWLLRADKPDYQTGVLITNWSVFFFALLWLAMVIGTGEYHRKHAGQRGSWRLFAWTFVIELVILAWYVLLYHRL